VDSAGKAIVIFAKSEADATHMYAVHGNPNAKGTAATWSSPIDIGVRTGAALANVRTYGLSIKLSASANGNVLAHWLHVAPCTTTTYNDDPADDCTYLVSARYLSATGEWEEPAIVADVPVSGLTAMAIEGRMNSRGDAALQIPTWERAGSSYLVRSGVALRSSSSSAYTVEQLDAGVQSGNFMVYTQTIGLDDAGNVLVGAQLDAAGTTDVVAFRGTVDGGMTSPVVVDARSDRASLQHVAVGADGAQILIWRQSNGTTIATFAATSSSSSSAFEVADLGGLEGSGGTGGLGTALVRDEERGWIYHQPNDGLKLTFDGESWSAPQETGYPVSYWRSDSGDAGSAATVGVIGLRRYFGDWATFDIATGGVSQPATGDPIDYVWGIEANLGLPPDLSLSDSGIAVAVMINAYDVLPSAAKPLGESRSVYNLWASYLK